MPDEPESGFNPYQGGLEQLIDALDRQTKYLAEIQQGVELDACLLDKLARITCLLANETHAQHRQIETISSAITELLELYRGAHPEQALELARLAKIRAELEECCPPQHDKPDKICHYEPCKPHHGFNPGDGYSTKSRSYVEAVKISEKPHKPWKVQKKPTNPGKIKPKVAQGPLVGPLVPVLETPHVLDYQNDPPPAGSDTPVTFRTFTSGTATNNLWPPDSSGAKSGDVVLMSGNLWLNMSTDGGQTFSDISFTKIFAADATYGGWIGDQVVHYVPAIDCFVLYVQSLPGTGANLSKNVVKVALASPADLKKYGGDKRAWTRQWDFTSDTFGLGLWLDFPDITYGNGYLYINSNLFQRTLTATGNSDAFNGKLFFELPLEPLKAGSGFSFQYAQITDLLTYSSPTQSIGDTNYWAAHINNSQMRIYSSKGSESTFSWRQRNLGANWPTAGGSSGVGPENLSDNVIGKAPDSPDWISEDHRIIGATLAGNEVWFAWTAASGSGGSGGFSFPQPHIQIAKFDVTQDYKFVEQTQVWNSTIAFAYPCITTNSDGEVGISLAWGGGTSFGSHAVGILGDFVVWFGEASTRTSSVLAPKATRFGDYLHVRLAEPDRRYFSAFGYSVQTATPAADAPDYLYVEFGRGKILPPSPQPPR